MANPFRVRVGRSSFSLVLVFFSLLAFLQVVLWQQQQPFLWYLGQGYAALGCPGKGLTYRRPFENSNGKNMYLAEETPKVVYVSGKFGRTKGQFTEELDFHRTKILETGVFQEDELAIYSDFDEEIRNDPRWKPHLDTLYHGSGRGGGYWFWKPLLVLRHLERLQEGDFLIYSDSDVRSYLLWTPLLLETIVRWEADFSLWQMEQAAGHLQERAWNKRDVYEKICPTRDMTKDTSTQYNPNHFVLRKTATSLQFAKDWVELASDLHNLDDSESTIPNLPQFQEHRHDQSLLNLLLKCPYGEPTKRQFKGACLGDWTMETFRLGDFNRTNYEMMIRNVPNRTTSLL